MNQTKAAMVLMDAVQIAIDQLEALRQSNGWTESFDDPGGVCVWAGPRVHKAEDVLRDALRTFQEG